MVSTFSYDEDLILKDAGLVASSAAATVGGSAKVIDLGSGQGLKTPEYEGTLVVDATVIEVASNDELFMVQVQMANEAAFDTTAFAVATLVLGAAEVTGNAADTPAGQYVLKFCNRGPDGTRYRYLRLHTEVAGTIATGINYSAYASIV